MNRDLPAVRPVANESLAQRAAGLLAQAKQAANDDVTEALQAMGDLTRRADDIALGGEVYRAGVRDEFKRLAEALQHAADRVAAIMARPG